MRKIPVISIIVEIKYGDAIESGRGASLGWMVQKKLPEKEKFKGCSEGQGKPTMQKSKDMRCRQRGPYCKGPEGGQRLEHLRTQEVQCG